MTAAVPPDVSPLLAPRERLPDSKAAQRRDWLGDQSFLTDLCVHDTVSPCRIYLLVHSKGQLEIIQNTSACQQLQWSRFTGRSQQDNFLQCKLYNGTAGSCLQWHNSALPCSLMPTQRIHLPLSAARALTLLAGRLISVKYYGMNLKQKVLKAQRDLVQTPQLFLPFILFQGCTREAWQTRKPRERKRWVYFIAYRAFGELIGSALSPKTSVVIFTW